MIAKKNEIKICMVSKLHIFLSFFVLSLNFIVIKVLSLIFFNDAVTRPNLLIFPIHETACYLTHFDSCSVECDVGLHKFLFCSFVMLCILTNVSKSSETTVSQHISDFFNSNIVIFSKSWGSGSWAEISNLTKRCI